MKRKVKLDEMHDARVSFLSVVDAGAIRAPFKIQKSEQGGAKPMLHFKEIFKDEAFEPRVVAVALAPDADLEAAKGVIEKAGLSTEIQKSIDGVTVFEQGEGALDSIQGQAVTAKLSDKVAVVVDVSKSFAPYDGSTDFSTNLKGQGLLPNFELAVDALRTTIFESLYEADGKKVAAADVKKAAEDFAAHLGMLAKELPEEVFKLEQAVNDSSCAMFILPPGDEHDKPADLDETASDLTPGEEVAKAEGEADEAAAADTDEAREDVAKAEGDVGDSAVTSMGADQAEFASGDGVDKGSNQSVNKEEIAEIVKASIAAALPDAISTALAPVLKSIEDAQETARSAVEKAEKLDTELGTSVLGEANADEGERHEVTNQEPPLMDTGMARLAD